VKALARRLLPGQDLYLELLKLAQAEKLEAAVILSAVGSLNKAAIRFADQVDRTLVKGPVEIVSITGTISRAGSNVHISVSDHNGTTTGGHLTEGSSVYTTVEVVIMDLSSSFIFDRALCQLSNFEEILIKSKDAG